MEITAIGIDLAKSVFQVHGVNRHGKSVLRKKLSRSQVINFFVQLKPCLIGMEACSSAHFWARELKKLGHEVQLIAPQFVKPYVKSNKNDAADAEAICEAVTRPNMRFVAPKSVEQQDIQCLHRVRSRRVATRTALCNELRGLLSEYGVVIPLGIRQLRKNLSGSLEIAEIENQITAKGKLLFEEILAELRELDEKIALLDKKIELVHLGSETSKRLLKIPGVGKLTATAVIAAVGNPKMFKNGREFSAWIGLVPKQHSSGGKDRLLGISKRGDVYLRTLMIHGARSSIRVLDSYPDSERKRWLKSLIERRGTNRAVVALANKNARQMWVLLARNEEYIAA